MALTEAETVRGPLQTVNSGPRTLMPMKKKYPSQSPEYIAWVAMIRRCCDPKWHRYDRYGGRGIKVCQEWLTSFDDFLLCVGKKPTPRHTLERTNNDGDYEPGNVVWATRQRQARNRISNRILEFKGQRKSLVEWSEEVGLPANVIELRIRVCGYSIERALTQPRRISTPRKKK